MSRSVITITLANHTTQDQSSRSDPPSGREVQAHHQRPAESRWHDVLRLSGRGVSDWLDEHDLHNRSPGYNHRMEAFINSAVDEKLAAAIFRTISTAIPSRYHWNDSSADWSAVMQHIECSWLVKRKYPGLGSDVLFISQIQSHRPGKRCRIPIKLKENTEPKFRRVFPAVMTLLCKRLQPFRRIGGTKKELLPHCSHLRHQRQSFLLQQQIGFYMFRQHNDTTYTKEMEKNLEETSLLTSRGSVTGDRLLTFDEIAFWQKYSTHSYGIPVGQFGTFYLLCALLTLDRPLTGSWSQSIKSIFRWHNETINIHSHSIGSIIFAIILPLHFYFALYRNVPAAQPADAAVFLMYFAGVASCFAVSAAFHTAGSHSQAVHKKYNRADCCGIVLLMWGASLASIHFAFICDARLKSIHWFLSSASATGCITFILGPLFIQPAYRNLRALTYLSLGLFAIVFILHGIYLHGFALQRRRLSLEWMGLMALLNFLGCAAYAFRIPESKFPGKFDFVGASHQIMHVAVLAAGLVHYHGLSKALLETRGDMQQHQISDRLPQVESLIQAFLMFRFHGGPGTSYEDILSSTAVGRDGTKGMLRNR
ncbi:HlyIII-domain-containing protein, partial [Aureobasidium melanogenum]